MGNIEGIEWLMKHGADIDTKTFGHSTPILFAVANGEKEAVRSLLKYDPDLDFLSSYNESPLIVAVKDEDLDMAEMLLRDSADVNLKDGRGYAALHFAAVYGSFYMVDMLLYYEADVNIMSNDGNTPLMISVSAGYADITDLLLQNRAHVYDADKDGFTPLMIAAQNGDTLIMDMLLRRGANIHSRNKYRYSALDLAIRFDRQDAVRFLLKKWKNLPSSEIESLNPYTIATTYRRQEIADILRENNITEIKRKGFDQISVGSSVKACFHDLYLGFSIAAREPNHGLGIFGGFDLKPGYSRVLVKESDNLFYQYMDKSYISYAGILKDFNLNRNAFYGNWYFTASIAAGYNFGNKFKGTEISPESRLRLIPSAGFWYNKDSFNFQIGLEYTNTGFYRLGPVWLRTGISYNLFFNNIRAPGKVIKW
jgi:ankyrin repeat protein